jgi:translation initiation factor IF-2
MVGLLEPVYHENIVGRADIKEIFRVSKVGTIAGCYVTDGKVERSAMVRLLRDDVVIYDGMISSLKRFKEDAKEVLSGFECGAGLENYNDIKPGDVLEIYTLEEMKAEL